jgi:hypothetical protein
MTSRLPDLLTVSGRYQITEKPLGEGGTGVVYKAYDTVTKGFVALKVLRGGAAADSSANGRARVSHPNIVDCLEVGHWVFQGQQQVYLVMPFLQGSTLEQLFRSSSQPLSVEKAVDIVSQACRGLQAAHAQGVVHGNIKPSNIFVLEDGTGKILDLGVLPRANSGPASGRRGTLVYMAPEQLDLKPATSASDIFSLAVVCYQALAGRQPFSRESEAATVEAIRSQMPPPAAEMNPAVNQMVSRTIHKAMAKQSWHRFSEAREFGETLQKAAKSEPIERFERSKFQPRVERVKKAHSEGDNEFALEILTELESEGYSEPDMAGLRVEIEQAIRQRHIERLLENARVRMAEEEYPLALQKIAGIFAIDPGNTDAQTMKEQIERLRDEQRIEKWFAFVREHLDGNLFAKAREGLQEVLRLDGSNTRARQMLAEIAQTEQEIGKVREEKQRLYENAVTAHGNGERGNALKYLERALAVTRRGARRSAKGAEVHRQLLAGRAGEALPDSPELDAQCRDLYEQIQSERDAARHAYDEGRKHLLAHNVSRAVEICEEHLGKHPADPLFQALRLEAKEVRRQEQYAAMAEVSRRVDAEPDLDKKYSILQEAVEGYPEEPQFRSTLKFVHDRRELVNAVIGRARQHEERAQFDDAAGQWDIVSSIYPLFPGLASELQRLARCKEEQVHVDAKAQWIEDIQGDFKLAEYGRAESVIAEALKEFPDDRELLRLRLLAEQGVERNAEVNALLKGGQELCAAKNYKDGLEFLRKAERHEPRNYSARAALLSALVAQARELITKDWRSGEPLVKEALELEPGDPVARSLLTIVDDHRRQDAAGERKASTVPPVVAARASESAPAVQVAAAGKSADPTVRPAGAGRATVTQPAPRREQPVPLPVASGLNGFLFKGPVWAIAALVAVALILAAGLYSLLNKPKPSSDAAGSSADGRVHALVNSQLLGLGRVVVFEANVPGTRFSEHGKPLSLASELPPGNHNIEAFHEGYLSEVKSVAVTTANTPLGVKFELRPRLAQLQISSSVGSGKLLLDDVESLELHSGRARKEALALGAHTVKIYDRDRPIFAFAFQVEPNQKPMLITPLSTQPVAGAVVASLGGSARIYATRGLRVAPAKAQVPALPPVSVPPLGLEISGTPGDPARFMLETGKDGSAAPQAVDGSAVPTLAVQLADSSEVTALDGKAPVRRALLTIAGAPPETLVFQNQVQIGSVAADGTFSKEIEPGSYSWEWRKAGFEARKEARSVKAGESLRLDGTLTPSPGNLALKELAPPARFFKSGGSWQQISDGGAQDAGRSGWWIHPGGGFSSLRSSSGSFSIDFLKKKAFRTKKINVLADFTDSHNFIVYELDGHNLTAKRIAAGKTVVEQKQPHGMEDNSSLHLVFEMSAETIIVKNRSGAVLSSIERRDPRGPLLIQNDNPLNISEGGSLR